MKLLRNFCRYFIASLFIFSGFVKAIDPLGSAYKFTDYFEAWNLTAFESFSLPLAFLLSSAELLIGLCLFLKIRVKVASWALLAFMVFFTFLTLIIALTDPVSDCGCFGDAWILTNWQTFYKNLFFMVPTLFIFFQRNKYSTFYNPWTEWTLTGLLFFGGILLGIYSYQNLPSIDFRPYRIGVNIPEGMEFTSKVDFEEKDYVLVYELDGVKKEFYLSNLPDMSEGWQFVERKDLKPEKELPEEPAIHDFGLSLNGVDYAPEILEDPGYSVLVVAYDLNKSNEEGFQRVADFANMALEKGYMVYGMSSTVDKTVGEVIEKFELPFDFYAADDITLKTMVRSNPGILLLKEGTIVGKWHHRNIPGKEFFEGQGVSRSVTQVVERQENFIILFGMMLVAFAALTVFSFTLKRKE